MAGPFIVCGLGQLGHCIVHLLLRLGEPVVCITQSTRSDWQHAAEADGARVVIGDARDEVALKACGLLEARAFIAATDHDAVNIEAALAARTLRPDLPIVVRLRDRVASSELEAALGAQKVLTMSALAAPVFVAGVTTDRTFTAFDLGAESFVVGAHPRQVGSELTAGTRLTLNVDSDRPLLLAPLSTWAAIANAEHPPVSPATRHGPPTRSSKERLKSATGLLGRTLKAIGNPKIVGVFALLALSFWVFQTGLGLSFVDALYFLTTTITTTGYGDISLAAAPETLKLYAVVFMLLGSAAMGVLYSWMTGFVVAARFRQLLEGRWVSAHNHVLVAGLSSVGYEVCEELLRNGHRVVTIDRDAEGKFLQALRDRTSSVIGDARIADTLHRAGVHAARAIIAATDDDTTNLAIGVAARAANPNIRVVLRIFDPDFAHRIRTALDIGMVVSAPAVAAPSFVSAALHAGSVNGAATDSHLLTFVQRAVDPSWVSRSAEDLLKTEGVDLLLREVDGRYRPVDRDATVDPAALVVAAISDRFLR